MTEKELNEKIETHGLKKGGNLKQKKSYDRNGYALESIAKSLRVIADGPHAAAKTDLDQGKMFFANMGVQVLVKTSKKSAHIKYLFMVNLWEEENIDELVSMSMEDLKGKYTCLRYVSGDFAGMILPGTE